MFVAQRELKVTLKGEETQRIYHPGEEISDFAEWPEVPRRAHLNMGYVSQVNREDLPKEAGSKKKATKKTVKKASVKKTEAVKQTEEVATESPDAPELKCSECNTDKIFKSPRALKTHVTLSHRK